MEEYVFLPSPAGTWRRTEAEFFASSEAILKGTNPQPEMRYGRAKEGIDQ